MRGVGLGREWGGGEVEEGGMKGVKETMGEGDNRERGGRG